MKNKQSDEIIGEFVFELNKANCIEDCFQLLVYQIENLGFLGITYSFIPKNIKILNNTPLFLCSKEFNSQFLEHYQAANFAQDDFTIKHILSGKMDILNWWQEEEKGILLPPQKKVIEVAKEEYHIRNGLSIPTLSNASYIAGASLISDNKNTLFNLLLKEKMKIANYLIQEFHKHIENQINYKKFFYLPLLEILTKQEKQVLFHAVSGQPLKTIQDEYDISSTRAGNIRTHLFKKLDVKNINQLTYLAGLHDLLEML